MTFTYTSTDLSLDLMKIRRFLGDTDSSDPLLTDEEINSASSQEGNVRSAAALCAEWIAASFARKADKTVGPLTIALHQKYEQYADLAASLRAGLAAFALPTAGGISIARKETLEQDTDRVEPSFVVGMFDAPNTVKINRDSST